MTREKYKKVAKEYKELMIMLATIEFLPENANFLTASPSGVINWYYLKPYTPSKRDLSYVSPNQWIPLGMSDNNYGFVGKLIPPPNWKDSLIKL